MVSAMEKTTTQLRSESITRDNIAKLQLQLDSTTNEGRRMVLEIILKEQRALIAPD
jgi:hypothetical protein